MQKMQIGVKFFSQTAKHFFPAYASDSKRRPREETRMGLCTV